MKLRSRQRTFIAGVVLIALVIAIALGSQMAFNNAGVNPVDTGVKDQIKEWADDTTRAPKTEPADEGAARVEAAKALLEQAAKELLEVKRQEKKQALEGAEEGAKTQPQTVGCP